MVLTEEKHKRYDYCNMEPGSHDYEEAEFGNTTNNEVAARVQKPVDQYGGDNWSANPSARVSKLGGPGNANKIGPNKLLKVMAGDRLDIGINYYVHQNPDPTVNNNTVTQTLATLLVNLLGDSTATSGGHGFASHVGATTSPAYVGMDDFFKYHRLYDNTLSKAYLNYLFFDENFNYVPYDPITQLGSYSKQIEQAGDHFQILPASLVAPKNGYAFVYVSNESDLQAVYFDNLAVTHVRRKILEETVYYPYGLKIQPVSAQSFQKPHAADKFQGEYSDYEEETGWNDFELLMQ